MGSSSAVVQHLGAKSTVVHSSPIAVQAEPILRSTAEVAWSIVVHSATIVVEAKSIDLAGFDTPDTHCSIAGFSSMVNLQPLDA